MTNNSVDTYGLAIKNADWPADPSKAAKLRDLPDTALFSEGVKASLSLAFRDKHNDLANILVHKDDGLELLSIGQPDFPVFSQSSSSLS